MLPKILIIDDDSKIRKTIIDLLEDKNIAGVGSKDAKDGLQVLERNSSIQTVLLDIWLGEVNGVDVLKIIRKKYPDLPVIVISGHGNIELAVQTLKLGAYDFLEKPFSSDQFYLAISRARQSFNLKQENLNLKQHLKKNTFPILGVSHQIKNLLHTIGTVAQTDSRAIILGENGTGKELVARQIHLNSKRAQKPFVEVNCAAIPEELIESELFGHEKGAFTGAIQKTTGKFEQANNGTLFLDEVGDMSLGTQAKMLRVLEDLKLQPVGSKQSIKIDVRVIAATNKDLESLIKKNLFREDLYYRLAVIPIKLSPLRDRKEDIPFLIEHFIQEFAKKSLPIKNFSKEALDVLNDYHWPGNVRELKNTVERLLILVEENKIMPYHLHKIFKTSLNTAKANAEPSPNPNKNGENVSTTDSFSSWDKNNFKKAKDEFEKSYLVFQLKKHNWNVSLTAKEIDLERSYLHRKIAKYNLKQE